MFVGLDEDQFLEILRRELSASRPIDSFEYLRGREKQLEDIHQALSATGRHIFIFGDRGVGKTSLAHTSAFKHQSSRFEPLFLACEPESTFRSVCQNLVDRLSGHVFGSTTTDSHKVGAKVGGISAEVAGQVVQGRIVVGDDLNEIVSVLARLAESPGDHRIVVIDEFDRVLDSRARSRFADLLKQVSDQSVPLTFIICGIGSSLDELLEAHQSAYRYIEGVRVPRLNWSGRTAIVSSSSAALGLEVDDDSRYRMAAISDGFPYYVHLVCEQLYWLVFQDTRQIRKTTPSLFRLAVERALGKIEPHLKRSYDRATQKNSAEYHEVLWAVADHFELRRSTDDVYSSYLRIRSKQGRQPLEKRPFLNRINALKKESHGKVLETPVRNWYQFRENVIRGYVRLYAEREGVPLALEHVNSVDGDHSSGEGPLPLVGKQARGPRAFSKSSG